MFKNNFFEEGILKFTLKILLLCVLFQRCFECVVVETERGRNKSVSGEP